MSPDDAERRARLLADSRALEGRITEALRPRFDADELIDHPGQRPLQIDQGLTNVEFDEPDYLIEAQADAQGRLASWTVPPQYAECRSCAFCHAMRHPWDFPVHLPPGVPSAMCVSCVERPADQPPDKPNPDACYRFGRRHADCDLCVGRFCTYGGVSVRTPIYSFR